MTPTIFQLAYTDKATGEKKQTRTWYIRYRDENGKQVKKSLSGNKAVAEKMARKILTELDRRKSGLIEPWEEQRKRPLSEHLAEWRGAQVARGNDPDHINNMIRQTQRLLDGSGALLPDDVSESRVKIALAALHGSKITPAPALTQAVYTKAEVAQLLRIRPCGVTKLVHRRGLKPTGNGKARRFPKAIVEVLLKERRLRTGYSTRSINQHVMAVKSFFNWMVRDRRLLANPLVGLEMGNPENDRRLEFATLTIDEIRSLIATARTSAKRFRDFTGTDRAMLYAVAVTTAFRPQELAQLTPADFTLDGPNPFVRLSGSKTKNAKLAEQALTLDLAVAMRGYLTDRPATEPVWPGTWSSRAADLLRVDLPDAGIPYTKPGVDGKVCVVSFYSLRHSAGLLAEQGGATLREVMTLMRHSDPKLTMRTYGRLRRDEMTKTVANMPTILSGERTLLDSNFPQLGAKLPSEAGDDLGQSRTFDETRPLDVPAKVLQFPVFEGDLGELKTDEKIGRCGDRTCDHSLVRRALYR